MNASGRHQHNINMMIQPRHVICVLHDGDTPIREVCRGFAGFEYDSTYSQAFPDARMATAFDASADKVEPSFTKHDWDAIDRHSAVSYVISPRMDPSTAVSVSQSALAFVAAAFDAGAVAVKGDSSGIAHGREQWLALHEDTERSLESALIRTWVRYPISDDGVLCSIGMHLLGFPDIEVYADTLPERSVVDILSEFMHFLVIDQPHLEAGHTYRGWIDATRFKLSRSECTRYEQDDFFYNPYGYWQLRAIE